MLPDGLSKMMSANHQSLGRLCPAVASIKIRMETQSIGTLVERQPRIDRAIRLLRLACIDYLNCSTKEKVRHNRAIMKLLHRLEIVLVDAKPSEAAHRLGKAW